MTKLNQRSKRTVAVVAALIVLAIVCRVLGNSGFYPRAIGLVRSIIYIFLFAVWGFSLQRRIMQNWQRRYMAAIAICMSFWFSLRTLKYHFIPAATMPGVARLAWYAYYIPMLLIPMLSLLTAVSLGKPEHYRPPRLLRLLWVPTILLILTVLTNDLHQTVFVFPMEYPIWTEASAFAPNPSGAAMCFGRRTYPPCWLFWTSSPAQKRNWRAILDEDRKVNAQKFEAAFYSNPDLRGVRAPEPPAPAAFDLAALVDQLQKSPELREMLASVLSGQNVGKADSGV